MGLLTQCGGVVGESCYNRYALNILWPFGLVYRSGRLEVGQAWWSSGCSSLKLTVNNHLLNRSDAATSATIFDASQVQAAATSPLSINTNASANCSSPDTWLSGRWRRTFLRRIYFGAAPLTLSV